MGRWLVISCAQLEADAAPPTWRGGASVPRDRERELERFHAVMLWLHYLVIVGEILRWCWEARRYAAAGRRAENERRQAPAVTNFIYAPSVHVTNYYGQMPDSQNPPRGPGVPDLLLEILRG